MSIDNNYAIVEKLKSLGEMLDAQDALRDELNFASDKEANHFCVSNPNAFFLGVIFDQGVPADRAWAAPYYLSQRLGHLDPTKIIEIPLEQLSDVFAQKPALHRYVTNMARYIQDSCRLLVSKYNSDAKNIWNDHPTAKQLEARLLEFKGIGQKKAAMAVGILARSFRTPIREIAGIDVAYDIHVRRVFVRSGLASEDNIESIISAARKYNPEFPGILDYPAWHTGRTWCHPQNPNCQSCILDAVCAKLLTVNFVSQGQLKLSL